LCWPMALFLVTHTIALPFVLNRGLAMPLFKTVLFYYAVLVASAATIDQVHKVLPIVSMFLLQFAWWGIHGLPEGRVNWHSLLSNEDGFGPVMVIGMAFAGFLTLGVRSKRVRVVTAVTTALCAIGIVASVARGAAMAGAVVLVVVWLRSHRKLAMFGALLFVLGTIVIASYIFYPNGEFWSEMASIQDDIASIDNFDPYSGECVRAASKRACGSANDRWDLWNVGWLSFLRSPLVGVGPGQVGVYAAEKFQYGEARGFYADPAHLYGKVMHNTYVQVLAEQGLIGIVIFVSILVDFMRRNRSLRTKAAIERWDNTGHGGFDLKSLSLGLEAGMVGWLASGVFYDQLYTSSLYTLVALNFVLSSVITRPGTVPTTEQMGPGGGTESGAPAPEQPHRREWWAPKPY
jgi:putative inorganic carbon (hco3(-)) transporter